MKPIRGVHFHDTHCGSHVGLLSPHFELPDPQSLALDDFEHELVQKRLIFNSGQAYLWKCWEDAWKWLPDEKLDFGIFNGDGLHGPAKRNDRGLFGVVTPKPSVQAAILKDILKPIRHRFDDFHMIAGTEWHEGEHGDALKQLAVDTLIDATPYPSGALVEDMLFLDWEDVILDFAHEISYFMIYRGTPLEREINFSRIEECLIEGAPDLLGRAHTHIWHLAKNRYATAFMGPAWSLSRPGMRGKSVARGRLTDIGLVYIEIYPELKGKDDNFIEVKVRRYNHPRYKAIKRIRGERR